MEEEYDVLIVGLGPAGYSSAVYCDRYKLKTILIGERAGGTMSEAWEISNLPSYKKVSGFELTKRMQEQVGELGIPIKQEIVQIIQKEKDTFLVKTDKSSYISRAIILCLGKEKIKLGIKDEDKFIGKGISYCVTCDAPLYKDKTAAVIGGGNSALMAAFLLSKYAKKVYILYRKEEFSKPDPIITEKIKSNKNIEIIFNSEVTKLIGNENLEKVEINNKEEVELNGLFIEIGSIPNLKIIQTLKIESEKGFIKTDNFQRTNIPKVYAAGDSTNFPFKQIVTACSQGAIAAYSAYEDIQKQ